MATVSLKERLKQFQALKESAQAKSEAAKAREDELRTLASKNAAQDSIRKLEVEADPNDTIADTKSTTVADEGGEANPDGTITGETPPAVADVEVEPEAKVGAVDTSEEKAQQEVEFVEEEVLDEGDEEVVDEEVVEDEVVEEVVEEVDGDIDDTEEEVIEEVVEEVVEEVEETAGEDDEDYPEAMAANSAAGGSMDKVEDEQTEELAAMQSHQDSWLPPSMVSEDTVDEKSLDEFAAEPHPIILESQSAVENSEELPMDELAALKTEQAKEAADGAPFDEHPIFTALDGEPEQTESNRQTKLAAAPPVSPAQENDDIEKGRSSNPDAGLPRGFNDVQRRRFRGIICCLLAVGACAIAAIVLPFYIDYDARGSSPTMAPTISFAPSSSPSESPSGSPTVSLAPSDSPTQTPSFSPTISPAPTDSPTESPTEDPTASPTPSPTEEPTPSPTDSPTISPSESPSRAPVDPTDSPTESTPQPTDSPTQNPTDETSSPTVSPTSAPVPPTPAPTPAPTPEPTPAPVSAPTRAPFSSAPVTPTTAAPVAPTAAPVEDDTLAPTSLRLGQFIEVFLVPISGEEVFEDQNSPQFRAAQYLAEEDDFASGIGSIEVLSDRYALTTLYFATEGDNWSRCSVDDSSCEGAWLTGDACGWEYLTCNGDGRIISVAFDASSSVGLRGSLPEELYALNLLEDLIIANEPVRGPLPARFGSDATAVRKVAIQGTGISGEIPPGYLSQSPVESFLMSENNLEGFIPLDLGNSQTLIEINLGGNQLVGSVPVTFATYTSLTTLQLDSNILIGSIPDAIYRMPNLERLYLNNNPLMTGGLSPAIAQLESIKELRVGGTGIGGFLPDEIFSLPNLEELDVSEAAFRGTLPTTISNLGETIKQLKLNDNTFTGTVPVAFGNLEVLNVLTLQGNDLVGSISPEICALRGDGPTDLQELSVDCDEVFCSCCTECFF